MDAATIEAQIDQFAAPAPFQWEAIRTFLAGDSVIVIAKLGTFR